MAANRLVNESELNALPKSCHKDLAVYVVNLAIAIVKEPVESCLPCLTTVRCIECGEIRVVDHAVAIHISVEPEKGIRVILLHHLLLGVLDQ